ncbi:MAG: DUF4331 domain-containing protein [Pyrinomonadaceae bacterium]|nr:DUF4331 domain-containing protein [Pyrinomonadaceae bacterium]
MKNILKKLGKGLVGLSLIASMSSIPALASSHAEAPLISMDRFADNTDTYAFRSVEPGREGFVTLIANWIPLQEPSGGPQYFRWDDTVLYEIRIDNTGDGLEDIKYQFQFTTQTLNGDTILGQSTVNENGVISSLNDPDYNMPQTYTVRRVDSSTGRNGRVIATGLRTPPNNIGPRTTPNYETALGQPAVYNLPNGGKVFAGTRDEYFYIDVGGVFDTLNLRSIGASGGVDTTKGYNVSTIAIEVPIQELTSSRAVPASPTASDAVIGVWATSSRRTMRVIGFDGTRTSSGAWQQVSRLGNPLVNEVVIPLRLKDAFNSLSPVNDAIAAPFVLDPQLARLLQAVYGIQIPPPPRNDLVQIFATGIPVNAVTGPNYTTFLSDGVPHEYLRLNVAIPITPIASISRLGLLGGDVAGFPNGRRPHDDVTDIALRAVAGGTPFTPATNVAPNNTLGDGVSANPEGALLTRFPYLLPPNPGNTPRTSNQTLTAERDWTKVPTVDENGLFKQ